MRNREPDGALVEIQEQIPAGMADPGPVGWTVTPTEWIRRRSNSIMMSTFSAVRPISTVGKSHVSVPKLGCGRTLSGWGHSDARTGHLPPSAMCSLTSGSPADWSRRP